MDFINLKIQQDRIRDELASKIHGVLSHGRYIMGPEVTELEEQLSKFIGVKHCIAVSSGTDALLIALMALGVEKDDEIITTPFSFIATAEVIALLGAKPIFVDIDSKTYNIDANKIEEAITSKTKAIMPVSLYGQCADFDQINRLANNYNIQVIEDAAQSFGAKYGDKMSCSLTDIACTSFFPSKPLGCYGDGGACFTDSDELSEAIKEIRVHGQKRRYYHTRLGLNGRIDTIQAAILLAKMTIFDDEIKLRNQVAVTYNNLFSQAYKEIKIPFIKNENTSVYAQYTIEVNNREKIITGLKEINIPTAVHYPVPLNLQPIFFNDTLDLPKSEEAAKSVMSVPMHPYLTLSEQEFVVEEISKLI
jgi:UDP-2-acetamido-2-deoxy-ribo-hexuluronate aminotransferase